MLSGGGPLLTCGLPGCRFPHCKWMSGWCEACGQKGLGIVCCSTVQGADVAPGITPASLAYRFLTVHSVLW
jgi:hypothetical protein